MSLRKKHAKHTFEDRLPYFLAFLIPMLIMIGVFAGKSIYPFGDKSFLRTDMYHQYAPFFMDFLEKLKHGESLTYAWEIGLGSNYTALIAYYLSSPFNLLLLVFPSSLIVEFMTYLIVLKIGLCGFTMAWYLGKRNHTNHIGIAFFGICYALSGYMAAYSWNIMWLDCLWLAPLILLGLERLVKENRPFLYCITLGLAILTNYYISIMLCIFMFLYFICLMIMLPHVTLKQFLIKCGRFALYSLIAGGLGAILLLPAAHALMGTASASSTFPKTLTSYFSVFDMLARHLVDVECEIGLDHWPNLYSGVATLLFLPMYYLNRRIPYKEKIVKTVLLCVMLLSFSLNIPNYIWHGMHYPNSLPCRQSFLYNILMLSMCFEGYKGFKGMTKGKLIACFWGVFAFVLLAEKLVDDSQNIEYHTYYASLAFIALYTLLLYLYKIRKIQMVTAFVLSMGVLVLEMGLNTAVTSVTITSRTDYWKNTDAYQSLLDTIDDSNFYRVEKATRKTKNDGAWVGYRSASVFSSTANAGVSNLYRDLGLEGNTNAYSFMGATPFTSSLLSVRYILSTEALPDSELHHFRESTESGIHLYENDYTLPLGFLIPSDTDEHWTISVGNPARVQNNFISLTTHVSEILSAISGSTSGSQFTTSVTERSHVYVFIDNANVDNVTASIGNRSETFSNVKRRYLLDLGYCVPGEIITLSTTDSETLSATAYVFNEEAFIQAYNELNSQPFVVTEMTDSLTHTAVTGQIDAVSDGLLFTSIPYDKGWSVTIDGVAAEAREFADTFLAIPVTAGTHTIELTYHPEGLTTGAMITGGSVLLLIICYAIYRLTGQGKKKRTARSLPEEIEGTSREDYMRDEELPKDIIPEKEPSEAEIEENEFPEDVPEKDKFPEIELSKEAIEENKFPEDAPEKDKFPEIELSEAAIEEEGTPDNELSKSEDSELEDFLAVSEEPVAETPDNKTPTADEAAVKDLPESKSVAVTAKFSPEEEDLLKLPEEEASSEKKIVIEEPAPVPEKKRNQNIEILEEILAELENGGKKR